MKNWQRTTVGVLGLVGGFAAVYFIWSKEHASGAQSTAAAVAPLGADPGAREVAPAAEAPAAARPTPGASTREANAARASDPANARGGSLAPRPESADPAAQPPAKTAPEAAAAPTHDHAAEAAAAAAAPEPGKESWNSLLPGAKAEINKGRLSLVEGDLTFAFGKIRQGELGVHEFQLVSDGEEPLVITGVKPSCGCTKAELVLLGADGSRTTYVKGEPIPLGQRFSLETEITTDGRSGPFSAQISVYGNDARGVLNMRLTAEIEPVLVVTPSPTVFFGRVTTADKVEQSVTVTSNLGTPFKLTPNMETVVQPLSVDFAGKDPDAEGRASEWEIKVSLGPSTPIGMRNYPVRFTSDIPVPHPKYPSQDGSVQNHAVQLMVQAQVTGMVSSEPSFITFGMVRPGEAVERSVRVECHDDFKLAGDIPVVIEGLQGQQLPFGDAITCTVEPLEEGRLADVKVKLDGLPADLNGSFGGVLKIQVGHPFMAELQVRFSGVCRPAIPAPPAK